MGDSHEYNLDQLVPQLQAECHDHKEHKYLVFSLVLLLLSLLLG